MAQITQTKDCLSCGTKNSITVISKQTKYSRTVKVKKCTYCNIQQGVLKTLTGYYD